MVGHDILVGCVVHLRCFENSYGVVAGYFDGTLGADPFGHLALPLVPILKLHVERVVVYVDTHDPPGDG